MDAQVVIAGAGPVGLAAALELTRRQIPVMIVDPVTTRSPFSKALAFNPRSQQLMDACGVTALIRAQAREITGMRLIGRAGPLLSVDFSEVAAPPNSMLALPQAQTEAIMEQQLATLGVDVQRGWRLKALEQKAESVLVSLEEESGQSRQTSTRYVLGADGAHSTTRALLGIAFPGKALANDWMLADIKVDTDAWLRPVFNHAHLLRQAGRFVFVLPVRPGLLRVVSDDEQVLENLPDLVTQANPGDTQWTSRFRVHHRLADTFARGRVFLAGDAAHIHSPVGGRGMNLGIEDACFFAECVANQSLHRYAGVRRKKAQKAIRMIRAQTHFATAHDPLTDMMTNLAMHTLFRLKAARRAFARRNMGLE